MEKQLKKKEDLRQSLEKVMEEIKVPEYSSEEPSKAKSFKGRREAVDMERYLGQHEDDDKI